MPIQAGDSGHVAKHNSVDASLTALAAADATEQARALAAEATNAGNIARITLTPTATKTTSYTAAVGDLVPVSTAGGAVTITLPSAPTNGSRIAVKHTVQGGTNVVTIAAGGTDHFNTSTGPTSATLTLLNQAVQLQYASGVWIVVADDLPLSQLDARFLTPTAASGAYVPIVGAAVKSSASRATLGAELLTNPTVAANSTGWTLAGGVTWSAGALTFPASGAISQSVAVVSGQQYRLTFTQSPWPGNGLFTVALGAASYVVNSGGDQSALLTATTTGTVTFSITADATVSGLALNAFSLKQITAPSVAAFAVQDESGIVRSELRANGFNSVALGLGALLNSTDGSANTSIGAETLLAVVTGHGLTAVGHAALKSAVTAEFCTAVGEGALQNVTNSYDNVAVGNGASGALTTGWATTALGTLALANNTASYNTAVGNNCLTANTTGGGNVGVGNSAGQANVTGSFITAIGIGALAKSTVSNNTAVGYLALSENTSGASNTAVGTSAGLYQQTGSSNTAVGSGSFQGSSTPANNTGSNNTAVGASALPVNTSGSQNVAVGTNALNACTTGSQNVAVGQAALQSMTTPAHNTSVGQASLLGVTTGADNTAVGYGAGRTATTGNALTTGARNTFLGMQSGPSDTSEPNDTVALGYRALVKGNYAVAIGSGATATAAGAVAIGVDSGGAAAASATANLITLGTANHTTKIPGLPAFVSGDVYLVVDSQGRIHKSALGPAS